MLELTILALSVYWLLSFFNLSLFPGIPPATVFTDVLSIVIILLIMVHFLT